MKVQVFALSAFFAVIGCNAGLRLTKDYTLAINMFAPLTGAMPLGDVCAESVDVALNAINNSPDILKKYNLLVKIVDDQCSTAPAVKGAIDAFLNYKPILDDRSRFNSGHYRPANHAFDKESAKSLLSPLLVSGGICSAACRGVGQFAHQFNFIDVTSTCSDPKLKNKQRYPNVYSFSADQTLVVTVKIAFLKAMAWRKVAFISDTILLTEDADTLTTLQAAMIDIVAEEFYLTDPRESVAHIKATDARVIVANCNTTCAKLACAAFSQGLYGPRYVWIFPIFADFFSEGVERSPGCDRSMTETFAERAILIGPSVVGATVPADTFTESGVTIKSYNNHLTAMFNTTQFGFKWRMTCFESVNTAGMILHNTEQILNKQNETLRDLIVNSERRRDLEEVIRQGTLQLDTNGLWGRTGFFPNTEKPRSPIVVIGQIQNGELKYPWQSDDFASTDPQITPRTLAKWDTSDGHPPQDRWIERKEYRFVPTSYVIAAWVMGALLIVEQIFAEIRSRRRSMTFCNYYDRAYVAGSCLVQLTVFSYPVGNLWPVDSFCKSASVIMLSGIAVISSAVAAKNWCIPSKRWHQASLARKATEKSSLQLFCCLLTLNFILIVVWLVIRWPPAFAYQYSVIYVREKQNLVQNDIWTCCAWDHIEVLATVIAAQLLTFLIGICLMMQYRSATNEGRGTRDRGLALNIIVSLIVSSLLVGIALHGSAPAVFGVAIGFTFLCSINTLLVYHRRTTWKRAKRVMCGLKKAANLRALLSSSLQTNSTTNTVRPVEMAVICAGDRAGTTSNNTRSLISTQLATIPHSY